MRIFSLIALILALLAVVECQLRHAGFNGRRPGVNGGRRPGINRPVN